MNPEIRCDLMVVGSGIAGMAAAAFASARGLRVAQAGLATSTMFASGCFDLLGVSPETMKPCDDPYAAIGELRASNPAHPYACMHDDAIRAAFGEFLDFCAGCGVSMHVREGRNMHLPTPVGSVKTTYAVPESLLHGVRVMEDESPCLLVDVRGLKGYSARQVAAASQGLINVSGVARVEFPGFEDNADVYVRQMALAMENPRIQEELVARIAPHVRKARAVGLPAMLGLARSSEVLHAVSDGLGVPVFEIPTMPPGIAGERLKTALDEGLRANGVRIFTRQNVLRVRSDSDGFRLEVGSDWPVHRVAARAVVLASGRFLGRGLVAERLGIREPLFDIPVVQPSHRDQWHARRFFAPEGHAVNRAGVVADDDFRPVNESGVCVHERLYAAGAILAHQDWMREKSGTGIAVCSAHRAVNALARESGLGAKGQSGQHQ